MPASAADLSVPRAPLYAKAPPILSAGYDWSGFYAGAHAGYEWGRAHVIDNGVLRSFLHNAYTGRRSGAGSTGSAVRGGFKSTPGAGARALSLVPGDRSPEELLAEVGDGVVVQSVTGLHSGANPVSGDFSVGVEGLIVRDGTLAEPVREATIASTLPRMLLDVAAVGADLTWLPGGAAGVTLLIGDMALAGR